MTLKSSDCKESSLLPSCFPAGPSLSLLYPNDRVTGQRKAPLAMALSRGLSSGLLCSDLLPRPTAPPGPTAG